MERESNDADDAENEDANDAADADDAMMLTVAMWQRCPHKELSRGKTACEKASCWQAGRDGVVR